MALTEQEARTKWCQFVRQMNGNNMWRQYEDSERFIRPKCIASDCMMWQFIEGGEHGFCRAGEDVMIVTVPASGVPLEVRPISGRLLPKDGWEGIVSRTWRCGETQCDLLEILAVENHCWKVITVERS